MGDFVRDWLPSPPLRYYTDTAGLQVVGAQRAKWVTANCEFHGGSDSMRINTETGAFVCMAGCGAKGGDVLAYHMAAHGLGFVEAAKALGAYRDDGKDHRGGTRPHRIAAHVLLSVVAHELTVASIIVSNAANGAPVNANDLERLTQAAGRILYVAEAANGK